VVVSFFEGMSGGILATLSDTLTGFLFLSRRKVRMLHFMKPSVSRLIQVKKLYIAAQLLVLILMEMVILCLIMTT
jgi:hypothetical protein